MDDALQEGFINTNIPSTYTIFSNFETILKSLETRRNWDRNNTPHKRGKKLTFQSYATTTYFFPLFPKTQGRFHLVVTADFAKIVHNNYFTQRKWTPGEYFKT